MNKSDKSQPTRPANAAKMTLGFVVGQRDPETDQLSDDLIERHIEPVFRQNFELEVKEFGDFLPATK